MDDAHRGGAVQIRLSVDVETIVLKALEKDRHRRYSSVADLAKDIQRYLSGEPIQARPPSSAYQLYLYARRHRAGLATAVAILPSPSQACWWHDRTIA